METRRRVTVSLPEYAVADIKEQAKRMGWSLSALAAEYILDAMYNKPNPETLEAIEEARSGAEMEELTPYDIEHFEEYVERL